MLRVSKISFPGFGIGEFSVDSVAFEIFGVEIAWYAILITFGMICCITYAVLQAKKIGVTFDDVVDFALFTIPIGVIGARLYYVLSEIDQYHSFKDVINIREGGLAIYGGIIAGTLTVLVVSHFKKISFLAFGDCVAPGVLLAQGIGRWANFVNAEAHGGVTDMLWGMVINGGQPVHPTFLYESIWDLAGFLFLHWYSKRRKFRGEIALMYAGWYGMIRFLTEFLRTDSLFIGNTGIKTSQLIGGLCVLISVGLLTYFYKTKKYPKPFDSKEQPETTEQE